MNGIRAWLSAVATFFVEHDLFIRFMFLFTFYIGRLSSPPRHVSIVGPAYETAFWILAGIVISVMPDIFVVAVDHPKSRRSQLILCSVILIIAVSVGYAHLSSPSRWVNAADKYRKP